MKINPTPINDPKLRDVMANFGTHKIMVCQHHPESQFSSKNPYQRSVFVLTMDCKCPVSDLLVIDDGRTVNEMTDEEVAQAMPDIVAIILTDAVSAYPTEATPSHLEKLRQGSTYGKDNGTVAQQFLKMRKSKMRKNTHVIIPREEWSEWAEYADIQKLDQLFVRLAVQEYAELYHKLASTYTEDKVMYQLNQYNAGITW